MLTRKYQFIKPSRDYRELRILGEIGENRRTTQRVLARSAQISLTVLNEYLDRMSSSGWVEIEVKSSRLYLYRLTPLGKVRLDELFFSMSREVIQFYGQVKAEFRHRLSLHQEGGVSRVVLFGAAETGEMVLAAGSDLGIEFVGVVDNDPSRQGKLIGGVRIGSPETIESLRPDAVIITSFGHMDEIEEQVKHLEGKGIQVLRL
jgi:FlaA1/EpsC-like NDP-sugar epimerase